MTKWELWKVSSFTWISWPVITLLILKKTQGFWVKTQKPMLFMPLGLPGGSDIKEFACNAGDLGFQSLGWEDLLEKGTAAAAAKSLQLHPTLCDPIDGSPPPSLGFSRQEHWSGLPFLSPMRESEVTQLCPSLQNLMNCSPPGSSIHGIFQAKVLEWGDIASPLMDYDPP